MENELSNFTVIGVHDLQPVYAVDEAGNVLYDEQGQPIIERPATRVARVRMSIGDKIIDEDFILPRVITVEEQLRERALKRIDELEQKALPGEESEFIHLDGDQVVVETTGSTEPSVGDNHV